jgi:hypothetical protein
MPEYELSAVNPATGNTWLRLCARGSHGAARHSEPRSTAPDHAPPDWYPSPAENLPPSECGLMYPL